MLRSMSGTPLSKMDCLPEAGLQCVPVKDGEARRHQTFDLGPDCGHAVQIRRSNDNLVSRAFHVKNILKESKWHLCNAAIDVRHAAVENTHHSGDRGGERSVAAAAEQRHFIAEGYAQVSCKHLANNYFAGIRIIEEAAIANESGDG